VLVHGLGVSSRYMVPTAEILSTTHRVFAPDLPGFGRSASPRQPYTIVEHARTLGAWMQESGIRSPVIVGNSYGCQVIAELMVQRPSCAAALVLSAPTVESTRRSAFGESARLLLDAPLENPRLVPIVVRDYLRAGPRTILFTLRDAIADRIEDKLPRVECPALIVRGTRDPLVSEAWVDRLANGMRCAHSLQLLGAPHAVNFSAALPFAAAIAAFVDGAQRGEHTTCGVGPHVEINSA
jgi:pimeloyl-ACP methyl ester carboxylesterase